MAISARIEASLEPIDFRADLIGQLRVATCAKTMTELLREEWSYPRNFGMRLLGCEVLRVHSQGQRGFVIDYEVRLETSQGERTERLYGELVGPTAEAWLQVVVAKLKRTHRGRLLQGKPPGFVACLTDPGLVLRFHGLDEKIPGLKFLHKTEEAMPVLSDYLKAPSPGELDIHADLLGHRLGKRCVVRFGLGPAGRSLDGRPTVDTAASIIAKMYKSGSERGRKTLSAMQALWQSGFDDRAEVRIPKPIIHLEAWNTVLMEDLGEAPLPCQNMADMSAGMETAGRVLGKLHGSPLPVENRHTAADEIFLLERWVGLIGVVDPRHGRLLQDIFAALREDLSHCHDVELMPSHRDFYQKQLLFTGGQAVLVDFDTLCAADPALDAGNFLAHLRFDALQTGRDSAQLEDAFLASYGSSAPVSSRRRVQIYQRSTALRLACLYSFSSRWRHLAEPLLQFASR